MSNGPGDADWPAVLSLSAHEVRSPLSALIGFMGVVLSGRAGPLTPQQRKVLETCLASCGKLKNVADQMSDLAHIEDGERQLKRVPVDLHAVLTRAIETLPESPEPQALVELSMAEEPATLVGDAEWLRIAFTSVIASIRRELVDSAVLRVRERVRRENGRTVSWIAIASADRLEEIEAAKTSELDAFDEWRGGCGLSLPVARRIIERHGGSIWSTPPRPPDFNDKRHTGPRPWRSVALAMLPHA